MGTYITVVSNRFGLNPREAKRFVKFLIVGMIGFVVDFGIFNLLLNPFNALFSVGTWAYNLLFGLGFGEEFIIHLGPTVASTISFVAAVISNFYWNRHWTYPDSRSRSRRRQFTMFFVVSVVGILIRIPIVFFTTPAFRSMVSAVGALQTHAIRLADNLSLAVAVLVVLFWNFFANRYWTYNDVE
ncbi:MAG: GtrA family protein [Anaerolineae bacterium]|nr:GtrA family protein [Promineifilum sp.]MCZ2114421.1 GtrA family protein [Anaerolineae bacterium]HNS39457.1 GtrA family protein [Promineifilum sp.]